MTDELDPTTFDLASVLAGQTYPHEDVLIPLDREAAARLSELIDQLEAAKHRPDPDEARSVIIPKLDELKEEIRKSSLTVTVTGLSREVARAANLTIQKYISDEAEVEPDGKYDKFAHDLEVGERVQALTWEVYITKIAIPDGQEIPLDEGFATLLVEQLPVRSGDLIDDAIKRVESRVVHGFDAAVKDVDFSSAP